MGTKLMNLIIKLPPKEEREEMINAWIDGLINSDYENFSEKVDDMLHDGFSTHGITCLFLHETTAKLVCNRVSENTDSQWIEAALGSPICLN